MLDTHIWLWWVLDDDRLRNAQQSAISDSWLDSIGVNVVSLWEIAKGVELGRIDLRISLANWFEHALHYPNVNLINLTPEIAVESTTLPGTFHGDPFDQMIVATARIYNCPLVTSDRAIRKLPIRGNNLLTNQPF